MKKSLLAAAATAALLVGGTAISASADTPAKVVAPGAAKLIKKEQPHSVNLADAAGLRLSGANRYETAVAISQAAWTPDVTSIVFLASGTSYPDALAMGPSTLAAGPLLLTDPANLTPVTRTEIARLAPCLVVVVGGTAAVSDKVLQDAETLADPSQCAA